MPPPYPPPPNPATVVILVGDTSSHPILHFYQVSSKYCEGYSSYKADKKSKTQEGETTPKVRVVILVGNRWSACSTFLPSKIKIIQRVLVTE